ncbi:MAG: MFS transporter [Isosphaeraceae bacterium]|nr:MFS transporter [Isosphaeraceae bacterium]
MSQKVYDRSLDWDFDYTTSKPVPRIAWVLCWLMFASTILNYMDRQAVSVVSEKLRGEFGISFEQFGWVIAAFQLSYAFFQVPAGYLADRLNIRWAYAGAVLWWSLAAIAVAWSPTFGVLLACRAVLGLGEAFNWPCALKVTARVLPPSDRGLGNGIFNSGAAVGAVLTPLVVTPLTLWFGWRWAFAAIGACGLVWVFVWLAFTRRLDGSPAKSGDPSGHAASSLAPFAVWLVGSIAVGVWSYGRYGLSSLTWSIGGLMVGWLVLARVMPTERLSGHSFTAGMGRVVRLGRFWVMCVVSISINVCWHFLVNWLPTYLKEDRGLEFVTGSLLSALPFLAADLGNLGGGAAARELASGGRSPARARWLVLLVCVFAISSGATVGWISSTPVTLVVLGIMAFGTAAFMANYFAFCQEVSERDTGLIVGVLGGIGNLFAGAFAPIAGRIRDQSGGFGPVFVLVGLLPFAGLLMLLVGWWSEITGRRAEASEAE